jgi:uncharacterized membrane protein YgaE (UPF0421/DUF939 family)
MDMNFVLPQSKEAIDEQLEKVEKRMGTLLQEIKEGYEKSQKIGLSPEVLEQKKLKKLEDEAYVPLVAEDIRKLVAGERDQW